ncbi:hypothetical protein JK635_08115 [Neobacillus sp. YIM B02564]|uniref:Tetratricopeptide repeat protein n=1 Tax=Neobacillus paridis TaxID=2803862 RepID=A0ABS1TLH7_9BACI|nr:hypothetical protein [Neobacillus paridis]MBL4952176.1 hypothetical protein [Neobacillus paridis]
MYDMKKVFIFLLLLILVGGGSGYYLYTMKDSPKANSEVRQNKDVPKQKGKEIKQGNDSEHKNKKGKEDGKKTDHKKEYTTSPIHFQKVYELWSKNDIPGAQKEAEKILAKHPDNLNAAMQAAYVYKSTTGKPEKSIEILKSFDETYQDNALLKSTLGLYYADTFDHTQFEQALDYAKQGYKIAKNEKKSDNDMVFHVDAYAWTLGLMQNFDESIYLYQKKIFENKKVTIKDPNSMLHYGMVLVLNNKKEEAKPIFESILALKVEDVPKEKQNDLFVAQATAKANLE